jgi:hypothetical protein
MKKLVFLSLFLLLTSVLSFGQENKEINRSTSLVLLVTDLSKTGDKLDQFIHENNIIPSTFIKKKNEINITLVLSQEEFFTLKEKCMKWGYLAQENSASINYLDSINAIAKNIHLLSEEKSKYESLVKNIDSDVNDKYFNYWEKIISIDKKMAKLQLKKEQIASSNENYLFKLLIREELSNEHFYGNSWINMPGLEYSWIRTEQAEPGISPPNMHGLALKYMFNWYKSYGLIALYKNLEPSTYSEIDETYMFAYGQDFYSRSLGRGQNKFFNLYISFNLGMYIASSPEESTTSWFVNPFFGLELFKTKHILIDNKVGYFLPYKSNRIQRGLMYNFSFNFIL